MRSDLPNYVSRGTIEVYHIQHTSTLPALHFTNANTNSAQGPRRLETEAMLKLRRHLCLLLVLFDLSLGLCLHFHLFLFHYVYRYRITSLLCVCVGFICHAGGLFYLLYPFVSSLSELLGCVLACVAYLSSFSCRHKEMTT